MWTIIQMLNNSCVFEYILESNLFIMCVMKCWKKRIVHINLKIWKHYITCSPVDALQWMGAVRMRVQTADKNLTIIHKLSIRFQSINECLVMWEAACL